MIIDKMSVEIKFKIKLKLWDAIKMRIAGFPNLVNNKKITIQELVSRDE